MANIRLSPPVKQEKAPEQGISTPAESAEGTPSRKWVIVTKDFTALGWAYQLMLDGEEVYVAVRYSEEDDTKHRDKMKRTGQGWIPVLDMDEAMKTLQSPETYWVFGENIFPEDAEALIEAGQKVWPGNPALSEEMEHDRDYATDVAEESGLQPPDTHEFNDKDEAISFLEAHPDKAYVMKINDNKFNYQTFVPVRKEDPDANESLLVYLKNMEDDPEEFILQERVKIEDSLEVNVEFWYYEGEVILASLGLEVKRKDTYDLGEMCGCGGDFMQFIPVDSPLVHKTIEKMHPFYKAKKYTGFADVNVIFTKDGTPHFLEVCNRFGYNSHPNMFLALGKDTFGNIMADYIDGKVEDLADRFDYENIGCSLTLFIDHPRQGLPIHIDSMYERQYFPFDGYKPTGEELVMTGYSDEIGILLGKGKGIEDAWKNVSEAVAFDEAVSFPDIKYRWDLAEDNYYNAPILRLKGLKNRGLLP